VSVPSQISNPRSIVEFNPESKSFPNQSLRKSLFRLPQVRWAESLSAHLPLPPRLSLSLSLALSLPLLRSARAPRARAREPRRAEPPLSAPSLPLPARRCSRARARAVAAVPRLRRLRRESARVPEPCRPNRRAAHCFPRVRAMVADRPVAAAVSTCCAYPRLPPVSSPRSKPSRRHRRRHRLGPATPRASCQGTETEPLLPLRRRPRSPPPFPKEARGQAPFLSLLFPFFLPPARVAAT
jgi:hypothetical protein